MNKSESLAFDNSKIVRRGRPCKPVRLSSSDRNRLEGLLKAGFASQNRKTRARVILLRADGATQAEISKTLGVSRMTVSKWTKRFLDIGFECLYPARVASKPEEAHRLTLEEIYRYKRIINLNRPLPKGQSRWTVRSMAKKERVSPSFVFKIWDMHGIKPHLQEMRQSSQDEIEERPRVSIGGLVHILSGLRGTRSGCCYTVRRLAEELRVSPSTIRKLQKRAYLLAHYIQPWERWSSRYFAKVMGISSTTAHKLRGCTCGMRDGRLSDELRLIIFPSVGARVGR